MCLLTTAPQGCANGSIPYNVQAIGGWTANLSSIQTSSDPGERAQWIWSAVRPTPNYAGLYFSRQYVVNGTPGNARLSLAVDDYAEVFVNGTRVGEYGSIVSLDAAIAAQSALKEFNITPLVVSGVNTIVVRVVDSPMFRGCSLCRFTQNSAGVVAGGFIEYTATNPGGPTIPPVLLGEPGVPTNQSSSVGLYGEIPGNYDTQPGINALRPPRRVSSTSVPVSYVNTNTGNHVLQYRDYIYPGEGLRFALIRFYNSMDPYSGPLGVGWMYSYSVFLTQNSNGQITIKHADGREVVYSPSSTGYTAVTAGVFDVLTRTASGFTLTRPNRNKLNFSTAGKLTSIVSENGQNLLFTYDVSGNLVRIQDSAQRSFLLTYLGVLLTSVKDNAGKTLASYEYASGRLTAFVDVYGKRTQYTYGPTGQLLEALQPNGVTTFRNTFDSSGRVIGQSNASGVQTAFVYTTPSVSSFAVSSDAIAPAMVTFVTDPLGRVSRHEFDSAHRLISITRDYGDSTKLNATTLFTYDASNNRTSVTDPNGNTTRYAYNTRGYVTSTTDPLGNVTVSTYDQDNHLTSVTDPRGNTKRYTYNARGLRVSETDTDGKVTRYTYTVAGDISSMTDANGRLTAYAYDQARNLVQIRDANENIIDYAYDSRGNRIKSTQQGLVTTHTYDDLNRLVTVGFPGGQSQTYTYDTLGNVVGFLSRKGLRTTMQYDGSNRLLNTTWPGGLFATYTYDAVGNRLTMGDARGVTGYSYDALDRTVRTVRSTIRAIRPTQNVSYTYDRAGNRTSITYPDGKVISYQYDAGNRLTRVTDWLSRVTTYGYDANGNATVAATDRILSTSFVFDRVNRVQAIRNSFNSGSDPDSVAISSYTYQRDAVGNRIAVQDGSGETTTYGYDALYELTSVTNRSGVASYQYDYAGNRIAAQDAGATAPVVSTYVNNVLVQAGATTFANDADGNRISATGPSGTIQYSWDGAGRLSSVAGPGTALTTYAYDGDGNRIEQIVNGELHEYTNDLAVPLVVALQEVVRPLRSDAIVTTSYAWGRSLISSTAATGDNFYVYDGLSSVVGTLGPDGIRKQRFVYDAWGQTTVRRSTSDTGAGNPFRFTGEMQDPGSGLYYLRARYYDPATARFLSPDNYFAYPKLPISLNRYLYVRNNPLRYIDRTGRDPEETDSEPQEVAWDEPVWTDAWQDQGWPFSPPWP